MYSVGYYYCYYHQKKMTEIIMIEKDKKNVLFIWRPRDSFGKDWNYGGERAREGQSIASNDYLPGSENNSIEPNWAWVKSQSLAENTRDETANTYTMKGKPLKKSTCSVAQKGFCKCEEIASFFLYQKSKLLFLTQFSGGKLAGNRHSALGFTQWSWARIYAVLESRAWGYS